MSYPVRNHTIILFYLCNTIPMLSPHPFYLCHQGRECQTQSGRSQTPWRRVIAWKQQGMSCPPSPSCRLGSPLSRYHVMIPLTPIKFTFNTVIFVSIFINDTRHLNFIPTCSLKRFQRLRALVWLRLRFVHVLSSKWKFIIFRWVKARMIYATQWPLMHQVITLH